MAHILVVEDEAKLAALARDYLQEAGHAVSVRSEGDGTVDWILTEAPDLVVLDIMLPGEDGLSICRRVRSDSAVPILMVTARVEEIDRLLGLELGADDYLCKPYSPRELVLRVRSILRRMEVAAQEPAQAQERALTYADLRLDADSFSCTRAGLDIELTPVEFRLLQALLERPGRVLSRAQLMDIAYTDHRVVSDRTIDSHMRNLRQKLGDRAVEGSDHEALIRSVYGVGYGLG